MYIYIYIYIGLGRSPRVRLRSAGIGMQEAEVLQSQPLCRVLKKQKASHPHAEGRNSQKYSLECFHMVNVLDTDLFFFPAKSAFRGQGLSKCTTSTDL